jgi:hypothetical protein
VVLGVRKSGPLGDLFCLDTFKGISPEYRTPKVTREHSVNIQGTFSEHSGNIHYSEGNS